MYKITHHTEMFKKKEVPPRLELGSLDSKSRVLTITPWDLYIAFFHKYYSVYVYIQCICGQKFMKKEVPPRLELGSLDSKSRVLTITPWDLSHLSLSCFSCSLETLLFLH